MAPRQGAASFVPISPTLDIPLLISSTPNFKSVQRVDARRINPTNIESLQSMIHEHVVVKGIPLIIENWHLRSDWQKWVFNVDWLKSNHGSDQVTIRDISNKTDIPMTLGHYINNLVKLTSKFTPSSYDGHHQRLYGKDLDCPPVWRSSLANILPESTFYLSTRADLMSSLPKDARAENMMCYVGHEGTYTPAHIEMCATLGQNIMISASQEGPNSEKGSSLWFMTQMADRDIVSEYWKGTLGHDLSIEAHFASLDDLRNAPFTVHIVEQKVGDYVLVPPLAPHQVWNRGTYTVKAAWNRVTVDTLEHALRETLPKIRLVCRDEQYKTRAIVYDTLRNYTNYLITDDETELKALPPSIKDDYIRLYNLFTSIMLDECFSPLLPKETKVELIPNEYNITCSFCRGNIFNRFLSCKRCPPSMEGIEDDPYDVCMDCYSRGRSCFCVSGLSWVEQHPWIELLTNHEKFRGMVVEILKEKDSELAIEPPQFSKALANLNKERKSLARVCQEALQARPYLDPDTIDDLDDEREIVKKKREGKLLNCHTCGNRHPSWKAMLCTNKDCGKAYCFGNLWRAYDMDPFDDCLAKHYWKCPVCMGICSCGKCRKKADHQPYIPKSTILGAITKHVADPRSVESLVDFGKGNVGWLTNGVSGGKRKYGEGENENGDAVSKWGPAFGAPDTAEPDEVNDVEEPSVSEDFNDCNIVTMPTGYKAHFSAAGLDVAMVPIDPPFGMSSFPDAFGGSKRVQNGDYVKIFENPPDIPISPHRYHKAIEVAGATPLYHSDDISIDDAQRQLGRLELCFDLIDGFTDLYTLLVRESDINPALTNELPISSNGEILQVNREHEYQRWDKLQDTPGLSTLERNPLAFLAAAGLMHSQQQEQGLVPTNEWDNGYQDQYYNGPVLHPTKTFGPDTEQDAPSEPYGLSGMFQNYQPHIDPSLISREEAAKGKSKKPGLSKKERQERVQGDIEYEQVEHTGVAEWVKNMKSKKSRRRKGSLIVTLKISSEAWRRNEARIAQGKEEKAQILAARFGLGEVSTDLTPEPKRQRIEGTTKSLSSKKKGRPTGSRRTYIEVSEEEEGLGYNTLLSAEEESEIMPKKTSRSARTGELVDGLKFENHRRTSLNKSSRSTPTKKDAYVPGALSVQRRDIVDLEDEANSPIVHNKESNNKNSQANGSTASKSRSSLDGNSEKHSDDAKSTAYKAAIEKALLDAKRMALATAEGRSPPRLSAYSSEAESRAESEKAEDSPPAFQVAIDSRNTKADVVDSEESASEDSISLIVGDIKLPPATRGQISKTQQAPKPKQPPHPSKQLGKRVRLKKPETDFVAPRTPARTLRNNGFTPINSRAAPAPSTGKRGRPKRDSGVIEAASPNIDSPDVGPPTKRARREIVSSTPNKTAPASVTPKSRGRPKKALSTPKESVGGADSPVPSVAAIAALQISTPKKKPGRPPRSSLSGSKPHILKSTNIKAAAPTINSTPLDASRSRKVIEMLTAHSPPLAGEDGDDDWF
ncbi:hypothetical protein ABW20_dc0101962 [Dactylellina cionopaga]|nr:hypothetical protein ABW20_dc0101962 [Dactylellina cionopaga]